MPEPETGDAVRAVPPPPPTGPPAPPPFSLAGYPPDPRARRQLAVAIGVPICALGIGGFAIFHYASDLSHVSVLLALILTPMILLPMMWTLGHRGAMRRLEGLTVGLIYEGGTLLAPYGIRHVRVLRGTGIRFGSCYRRGRRAWIVLGGFKGDPGAYRFMLAHEAGHAIRNDSTRRRVRVTVGIALIYAAVTSLNGWLMLVTLVAVVAGWSLLSWNGEIASDQIAVRGGGLDDMESFARAYQSAGAEPQNRTVRGRIRRAFGHISHPPMAWRLALQRASTRS